MQQDQHDDKQTVSLWMSSGGMPPTSPLGADARSQVCVVGAGIAGMTTAYLLAREGKSVVVLDDGPIGGGMTQRTTAHLSNAIDDRYTEIERLHGEEGARLAAESHTAAIDRIEAIVAREEIDCDFERLDGFLFVPPGHSPNQLDREMEAAHRAGLSGVRMVERAPMRPFDTGLCLRFARQGQFHPLKYLSGLARAIQRLGGRIHTGTHAGAIYGGSQARVETTGGYKVAADAIVVATNTPVIDLVKIHTKQAPYTTYVIGARVPAGSVARALYWDTADPYHYIRLQSQTVAHDILVVGGEDHRTGLAQDGRQRHERLESWARERFPMMTQVEFRWSGQVMEPADGLAFIGRDRRRQDNVFIATGDSGMGMTHGTIAGMLITDLVMDRPNPWEELYNPSRKTLRALSTYAEENLHTVRQTVSDYLSGGEVDAPERIVPGEGAVLRRGLRKIAAYRDEQGTLHERSAACRHLGCIVKWNSLEKTWDCPCHGSRYDRFGEVFNGPANKALKKLEDK